MDAWDKNPDPSTIGVRVFLKGMSTVWRLVASERRGIVIGFAIVFIGSGANLLFPYVGKLMIDEIQGSLSRRQLPDGIGVYLVVLLLIKVGSMALGMFVGDRAFFDAVIRLENHLPVLCHNKLLELPLAFHEKHGTGRNISKITKGCDKFIDIVANLYFGFVATVSFWVLNLCLLLLMDARIAALLIAPIVPALWLYGRMFRMSLPVWEQWEEAKEKATSHMIGSMAGVTTVQAFVREEDELHTQEKQRHAMRDIDLAISTRERMYYFAMSVLINLGYLAALAAGVYFIRTGTGTLGTLTYVFTTGVVTVQGFWDLVNTYRRIVRNMVAAERMRDLLDEPNMMPRSPDAIIPAQTNGNLEFSNVSFCYPGKQADAIVSVSLNIPAGSMVALVGRSGAGKTTLAKLLYRGYDVTDGCILLDGNDIRDLNRDWYRRLFAMVKQDVDIFEGTVTMNVALGDPMATPEQIREAVFAAHLGAVLTDTERFPLGLETIVGERGVRLSGGERQRVGIARAYLHLVCGARFLILDEATSNLDSEAERAIQEMVQQLRRQRKITIITIAHRLSTIRASDQIFVIEKTVTESGTHRELLVSGGTYAHLVQLQALDTTSAN